MSISRTRTLSCSPASGRHADDEAREVEDREELARVSGTTAVLLVAAAQAAHVSASR
ncbi:hypothetical protein [Streptomyces lanatus]|uniref:Uncharacterized protein n=1 Tax=Streptomyces lanatus TaxID=66900 RepID=A0ABV1Y6B1_9ACTN|nr:hypothetical protein [Streptomyces lanatus]